MGNSDSRILGISGLFSGPVVPIGFIDGAGVAGGPHRIAVESIESRIRRRGS